MCKVSIKLALFLMAGCAYGQTVNPNQIRPAAVNGYVLTTVGGATVWAPAGVSGTYGPLSGDTDSTNCGNNNFVGTPVTQGSTVVQAYGFTNANSSPFLVEKA